MIYFRDPLEQFGITPYESSDYDNYDNYDDTPNITGSEKENDSWEVTKGVKAGVDQIQGIGYGLTGVLGDLVGSDSLRDWGLDGYQRNMEEAKENKAKIHSYDQVKNVGDAIDYVMFGLGNALPMFAPSIVTGGVGAIAARKAAQTAVTKLVQSSVSKQVAKGVAEKEAVKIAAQEGLKYTAKREAFGGTAGAMVGSVGLETGSIYGEVYEETGEHRADVALSFGAMAGMLDGIPIGAALNRMGMGKAKKEILNGIRDGAGTFLGKQVLKEASTEALQTIIERSAIKWVDENKDIFTDDGWKEITNAAILGGLAGGVFSVPSAYSQRQTGEERSEIKEQAKRQSIASDTLKSLDDIMSENGGGLATPSLEELEQQVKPNLDLLDPEISAFEEQIKRDLEEYSSVKPYDNSNHYESETELEMQKIAIQLRERIVSTTAQLDAILDPEIIADSDMGITYDQFIENAEAFEVDRGAKIDAQNVEISEKESADKLVRIGAVLNDSDAYPTKGTWAGEVTLETAIRNLGGLNFETEVYQEFDKEARVAANTKVIGKPLFSKYGKTEDEMYVLLKRENGWDKDLVLPGKMLGSLEAEINGYKSYLPEKSTSGSALDFLDVRDYIEETHNIKVTRPEIARALEKFVGGSSLTGREKKIVDVVDNTFLVNSKDLEDFYTGEHEPQHSEYYAEWYNEQHQKTYDLIREVAESNPSLARELMENFELDNASNTDIDNYIKSYLGARKNERKNKTETDNSKPVQADSRQGDKGRNQSKPAEKNEVDTLQDDSGKVDKKSEIVKFPEGVNHDPITNHADTARTILDKALKLVENSSHSKKENDAGFINSVIEALETEIDNPIPDVPTVGQLVSHINKVAGRALSNKRANTDLKPVDPQKLKEQKEQAEENRKNLIERYKKEWLYVGQLDEIPVDSDGMAKDAKYVEENNLISPEKKKVLLKELNRRRKEFVDAGVYDPRMMTELGKSGISNSPLVIEKYYSDLRKRHQNSRGNAHYRANRLFDFEHEFFGTSREEFENSMSAEEFQAVKDQYVVDMNKTPTYHQFIKQQTGSPALSRSILVELFGITGSGTIAEIRDAVTEALNTGKPLKSSNLNDAINAKFAELGRFSQSDIDAIPRENDLFANAGDDDGDWIAPDWYAGLTKDEAFRRSMSTQKENMDTEYQEYLDGEESYENFLASSLDMFGVRLEEDLLLSPSDETYDEINNEIKALYPKTKIVNDTETHTREEIDLLASETNTNPSDAQIEAENYKKGRIKIAGLNIAIENPKGSTRSGVDPNGKKWSTTMKHDYGDISRTKGADGDAVDVFIGENPESDKVFIVDQVKANGHFDEHKVMLGFNNQTQAVLGYKANYSKGWKVGKITALSMDEFKDWLKNGDTTKKAEDQKINFPLDNIKKLASLEKSKKLMSEAYNELLSNGELDKSEIKTLNDYFSKESSFDELKDLSNMGANLDLHQRKRILILRSKTRDTYPYYIPEYQQVASAPKENSFSSPIDLIKFRKENKGVFDSFGMDSDESGHFITFGDSHDTETVTRSGKRLSDFELGQFISGGLKTSDYKESQEVSKEKAESAEKRRKAKIKKLRSTDDVRQGSKNRPFTSRSNAELFVSSNQLGATHYVEQVNFNWATVGLNKKVRKAWKVMRHQRQSIPAELLSRVETIKAYNEKTQTTKSYLILDGSNSDLRDIARFMGQPAKQMPKWVVDGEIGGSGQVKPEQFGVEVVDSEMIGDALEMAELSISERIDAMGLDYPELTGGDTTKKENDLQVGSAPKETEKSGSNYGAGNKLVTSDRAEEIRKKLRAKLGQLNAGIDPETMALGAELAVFHIEAGTRKFADFVRIMVKELGEESMPFLRSWYEGARYYPGNDSKEMTKTSNIPDNIESIIKEEVKNASSKPENLEPDSNRTGSKTPLGAKNDGNESNASDKGDGKSSDDAGKGGKNKQSDSSLSNSVNPIGGTKSDTDLFGRAGEFGTNKSSTESRDSGRGDQSYDSRLKLEPKGSGGSKADVGNGVLTFEEKVKLQKSIKSKPVLANQADIVKTLPVLLDNQQEDVFKAEKRFLDGHGMMFTNGTGTGKTFVGLGIAKRFMLAGKKRGLFLAPTEPKVKDWINDAKHLGMDLNQIENTQSSGKGLVVTTYANFGSNTAILEREFDFIIADEAHYFTKNQTGKSTVALGMLRAITNHEQGTYKKANWKFKGEYEAIEKKAKDRVASNALRLGSHKAREQEAREYYEADFVKVGMKVRAYQETLKRLDTKVTFLSATPFAYVHSVDYANGFLFDYNKEKDQQGGYNQSNGMQDFMIVNFGMKMKSGKLNRSDASVDNGLMERRFHKTLTQSGALSGRKLELDKDYSRDFVVLDNKIGAKIDEGMQFLGDEKIDELDEHGAQVLDHDKEPKQVSKYPELSEALNKHFDYLARRKLLESIKAKESIARIKKHLALGRKVIVFHDYNIGGSVHPFKFDPSIPGSSQFAQERPDLVNLDLSGLIPANKTLERAFGDKVAFFRGGMSGNVKVKQIKDFNNPDSGLDILMLQADAGREGVSLHDTIGTENGGKQRVLINLGMPTKPVDSTQIEGRGYRFGLKSNFPIEYLVTGARFEEWAFASTISTRASTAEHLAMGDEARDLARAFKDGYLDASSFEPHADQGAGGKESDRASFDDSPFQNAISDYYTNEKRTSRNKGQGGNDYFATPEPLGFKMVEWLNLKPDNRFLEPSAGHGAIARYAPEDTVNTFIEPSYSLQPKLKLNVGDGKLVESNFEAFNTINKFEGVAMNPPFGKAGKLAIEHIDKASQHLTNGGRIIAIMPRGSAENKIEKWLEENPHMKLRAVYRLPQKTFERAGTGVMTQVIILDKVIVSKGSKYVASDFVGTFIDKQDIDADTVNRFFELIEDLDAPPAIDLGLLAEANKKEEKLKPYTAPDQGKFNTADFKHSKTGADQFVAQVKPRLDDDYRAVAVIAKASGGKYSRFASKEIGAIRGFLFNSAEKREEFMQNATKFMETQGIEESPESYKVLEPGKKTIKPPMNMQRDLFVSTKATKAEKVDQLQDIFHVVVGAVPIRTIYSTVDTIKSQEDVALLLTDLRKKAQETFIAVAVDKNGKVLRVIHHSSGLRASSLVSPQAVVSELATIRNIDGVYFAHNHPSGATEPSVSDRSTTGELEDWLSGTGIKLKSHVILSSLDARGDKRVGQATYFDTAQGSNNPFLFNTGGDKSKAIQITEREIISSDIKETITSPQVAFSVVQNIKAKDAIILLDNSHGVAGVVMLTAEEMNHLRKGDSVKRLLSALDKTNSEAVIIKTDSSTGASNVVKFFRKGVRVLDWISEDDNGNLVSDAQVGGATIESRGDFYRAESKGKGKITSSQIGKFAKKVAKTFQGSPVTVVNSEFDLPLSVQSRIELDNNTGKVKGLFHNGEIYIVGNNHSSLADLQKTVLHETVAHYGLKKLLGDSHSNFIDDVYASMSKEDRNATVKKNGISRAKLGYEKVIAEEFIANIAEKGQNPTLIETVISLLKKYLSKIFGDFNISKGDLRVILEKSHKNLTNKKALDQVILTRESIVNGEKVSLEGKASDVIRIARKRLNVADNLLRCVNG